MVKNVVKPRIMTKTDSYVTVYPQFVKLADTQLEDCHWTSSEIEVDKDKQDMRVNMSPAEYHAVTTALKLFVRYELFAGKEYWMTRVANAFPRPEIQRMAAVFGCFELGVHAPFYNKLNEVLGLDTDEFYESYVDDPILNDRVQHLNKLVDSKDDMESVAMFSIVEGAILFSSFALFKSFQSNGSNRIVNAVSGVNQSVVDEGLHQTAGAVLFRTAIEEMRALGDTGDYERKLHKRIRRGARKLYEHECRIAEMLLSKGDIKGITLNDMKAFIRSRINICLSDLGIATLWKIRKNRIAEWFYDGVQKYQANDFFVGQGREYTRSWNEDGFEWVDFEDVE